MSDEKYPVGTKLLFVNVNIKGVVVPNYKFPGDICVDWESGQIASYDEWFLNENCEIIPPEGPPADQVYRNN